MLGAIIGDMVGSVYEFSNKKASKDFNIFNLKNKMTDDSILTLEVAKVLMNNYPINCSEEQVNKIKRELILSFTKQVRDRKDISWGEHFMYWGLGLLNKKYEPYNSCGNGSAMRISPVGWIANSVKQVKTLSKAVSEITHNHPEGLKGAEAVAMCIYLAKSGKSKRYIMNYVCDHYYPNFKNFNFNDLVKNYHYDLTCQGSCPQAIYCFLISDGLEDAIRNCVAIGGDCDTTGAMAGAIAEAFYQTEELSDFERKFLYLMIDKETENLIKSFYKLIGNKKSNLI